MEIHQSISQNTPSFLVQKILYFKIDSRPQKCPFSLTLAPLRGGGAKGPLVVFSK